MGAPDLRPPSLPILQCLVGTDLAALTAGAAPGRKYRCSRPSPPYMAVQHSPRRFSISKNPYAILQYMQHMPLGACKNPLPNLVCYKTALMLLFQTSQVDKMHPKNYSLGLLPEAESYATLKGMQTPLGHSPKAAGVRAKSLTFSALLQVHIKMIPAPKIKP